MAGNRCGGKKEPLTPQFAPPSSLGRRSTSIFASCLSSTPPKLNFQPSVAHRAGSSWNVRTAPQKCLIGRDWSLPKRVWPMTKPCANMRQPRASAWFNAGTAKPQNWERIRTGAASGTAGRSATGCANSASRKTWPGKRPKPPGATPAKLIRLAREPRAKHNKLPIRRRSSSGRPTVNNARQPSSTASRKTWPGISAIAKVRRVGPRQPKPAPGSPSWW